MPGNVAPGDLWLELGRLELRLLAGHTTSLLLHCHLPCICTVLRMEQLKPWRDRAHGGIKAFKEIPSLVGGKISPLRQIFHPGSGLLSLCSQSDKRCLVLLAQRSKLL